MLAIEDCLIGRISELFQPSNVVKMSPEDISRLAGETTESSIERKRLEEKRRILDSGLRGLKGLQKQRNLTRPAEWDPVLSEDVESKPGKTTPSSRKASIARSVGGPSLVIYSRDKADTPLDGDFELPTTPRPEQWSIQESQMTRDDEWDFAILPTPVAKKGKSKVKLNKAPFAEPAYELEPEQY